MTESDKGTFFQPGDWMQLWATAIQDWQRTYGWMWDGFAQRTEGMTGARGGRALTPDDLMRFGTRLMENWSNAMKAMPGMTLAPGFPLPEGMGLPGGAAQQQIGACAAQAYLATMSSLVRWWMRVAQAWG